MGDSSKSVTFECVTGAEAERIRYAVGLYRHVLKQRGQDPRNYAPANNEGAGFGWDAVERAAADMYEGSRTHMSVRMADAMREALETLAMRSGLPDDHKAAKHTAGRLAALTGNGGE